MVQPVNNPPVLPPASSSSSSSSSSASSSSSSSSAALKPVEIALNRLSLSAVQCLWNEKVGELTFFNFLIKVPALISYAWNKSTAVEDDKAHGATIAFFNEKTKELVTALNARQLTETEATAIGVAPATYCNPAQQQEHAQLKLAAERVEKEFYTVFKERCVQLNVDLNSNDGIVFAEAASKGLMRNAADRRDEIKQKDCLITKIKTASISFNGKVYNDLIQAFADQPVAQITPDNFKKKVADLKKFYPNNTVPAIEASLRRAISTAANKTAMGTLATEYLAAPAAGAALNPKADALKVGIKAELDASLATTNARMHELCGNHFDGLINAAHGTMATAQAARDAARVAFHQAYGTAFNVTPTTPIDQLVALDMTTMPAALQTAKADLVTKQAEFVAAEAAKKLLTDELDKLAVWTGANITGGKHFEVSTKLTNLDATVRAQATKTGNFFTALCIDVPAGQEDWHSVQLNNIINS